MNFIVQEPEIKFFDVQNTSKKEEISDTDPSFVKNNMNDKIETTLIEQITPEKSN